MGKTGSKTEVNDRIAALISALGMNNNSFSVAVKVAAPVIYNIVDPAGRRSKPSFEVLEKILLSFDNINLEWLLLGKGENMFIAHPNAHLYTHPSTLKEPKSSYKNGKTNELELENMRLKAENEALYKAFRELGSSGSKKNKSA
jgi:hypothetical protein